MRATHTPGPWRASGCAVETSDAWRLVVAILPSRVDPRPTPDAVAETRADRDSLARLIAAAPEMLGALEAVVSWAKTYGLDVMPYRTGCSTEQPVIARARAAIARARGEVSP